jgi:hypothetical protein
VSDTDNLAEAFGLDPDPERGEPAVPLDLEMMNHRRVHYRGRDEDGNVEEGDATVVIDPVLARMAKRMKDGGQ